VCDLCSCKSIFKQIICMAKRLTRFWGSSIEFWCSVVKCYNCGWSSAVRRLSKDLCSWKSIFKQIICMAKRLTRFWGSSIEFWCGQVLQLWLVQRCQEAIQGPVQLKEHFQINYMYGETFDSILRFLDRNLLFCVQMLQLCSVQCCQEAVQDLLPVQKWNLRMSVDRVGMKGGTVPLRSCRHAGHVGYSTTHSVPQHWNGVGGQRHAWPLYLREIYPLPIT
jgi:plasmid maintenance system antidote protein VapI